jgi:hypothetical protein
LVQIRWDELNLRYKDGQFPSQNLRTKEADQSRANPFAKKMAASNIFQTLRLSVVLADRIGSVAAAGHLALQLLEAPASFGFAIVDKLDRSVTVKRPGDERV